MISKVRSRFKDQYAKKQIFRKTKQYLIKNQIKKCNEQKDK